MATLTKANNATNLNLAGSWSPAQVPTAADTLVFDQTFDTATGIDLLSSAAVSATSWTFGGILGGGNASLTSLNVNRSTLSSPNSPLIYPWSLDSVTMRAPTNLYGGGSTTANFPTDATGITLSQPNGFLQTPGFPNRATASTDGWVVLPALGAGTFYVIEGTVAGDASNLVRIYDGSGTGGTLLRTLNSSGVFTFTSTANQTLSVRWTTSASPLVGTGCLLTVTAFNGYPAQPNTALNLQGGITAPDYNLTVSPIGGATRQLSVMPSASNVSVTFPLTTGTPLLGLLAAPSDAATNNYALSMQTGSSNVTVPALVDATLTTAGYQTSAVTMSSKTTILGHPTQPTAVTIESPATAVGGLFAGNGVNNAVNAVAQSTGGALYFAGSFSGTGSGTSTSCSRIVGYDATTKRAWTLGQGTTGTVLAVASDATNNLYVAGTPNGFAANGTGTNTNFSKFDMTNQIWVDIGNGVNGTVRAIAVSPVDGKVYLGGSFTATTDGLAVARVACFDPTTNTYSAMGSGAPSQVNTIAIASNGDVYVGSNGLVGGTTSWIAKWTPSTSTWVRAGSTNITQNVTALAYDTTNNRMYFGGAAGTAGVINVATQVTTTLTVPGTSPTVNALSYNASNSKLYVGTSVTPFFQDYNPATTTWTTVGGWTAVAPTSLFTDASGGVWVGTSSIFTLTGIGTASRIAKYTPSTATWSRMDYGYVQALWGNTTSTSAVSELYSGLTPTGTPLAVHGTGTKTYTITPGNNLTILNRQTTQIGTIIRVRRGGALLEQPSFDAQNGTLTNFDGQPSFNFMGASANLTTGSTVTSAQSYVLRSNATRLDLSPRSFVFRLIQLNAKGTEVVANGSSTYVTGSLGSANLIMANQGGLNLGAPEAYQFGRSQSRTAPYGAPRQIVGTTKIGQALAVYSSYFRANGTFTLDPALPAADAANAAYLAFGTNRIVEWTSTSDVVLGGAAAEIRLNSFANLSYLGPAKYHYTGVGALSMSKPIIGSSAILVMEEGSGALTFNSEWAPYGTSVGNNSAALVAYNSGDNVVASGLAPVFRTYRLLTLSGTGTFRIIQPQYNKTCVQGGARVTVDFSDAGAPASNLLLSWDVTNTLFESGTGTITFKGKPGAVTTQRLNYNITTSGTIDYAGFGDSYLTLDQNGATSLGLNITTLTTAAQFSPLYVSGLSGWGATLTQRTAGGNTNGLQWGTSGSLILLGSSGDANWMAYNVSDNQPIAAYSAYTTLPTTGGTTTTNYSVSGTQVQTGNTSAQVIKAIQTTNANSFTHTGYTVTATAFLLTGNQGGTYDIIGTQNSAFALSSTFISNCSNAEMRILTQLNTSVAVTLSGPGTISLGSPTITYVSAATAQVRYLNATETRIYAGTDNQTPSITTTNLGPPQIYVGAGSTLRLLGAGTGRTLNEGVTMSLNTTLQVDEDWTVATVVPYGHASGANGSPDQRFTINVAATKTLTLTRWTNGNPSVAIPSMLQVSPANRQIKKGAGTIRYRNLPFTNSAYLVYLQRIEQGSIEFNVIDPDVVPQGYLCQTGPMELLSGTSCVLNSTVNHEFPFVIFGAGSVTKQNTGTVYVRTYNSFTGGLTITAGEYNAQYRQAVGDGNVTVSGGILRASACDEDEYVLEIAGNLVFSGGSLAIGDAYVV